MTKLSPDARDLIEAARAGEGRPPCQARERVRAGVLARVGTGAAVGSAAVLGSTSAAAKTAALGGAAGPPTMATGLLFKLAAGVGVAGVLSIVALKAGVLPSSDRGHRPAAVTAPARNRRRHQGLRHHALPAESSRGGAHGSRLALLKLAEICTMVAARAKSQP